MKRKYTCSLPRDIIEHIRGFSEPEKWYASEYRLSCDTEYFQKRIKKYIQPKEVRSFWVCKRIFFTNKDERDKFDRCIAKLNETRRSQIFYFAGKWLGNFGGEMVWKYTNDDEVCTVVYNHQGGYYSELRQIAKDKVPFVFNNVHEFWREIFVPLIEYDTKNRKRKRGVCVQCTKQCPRELDSCTVCTDRGGSTKYPALQVDVFNDNGATAEWDWT